MKKLLILTAILCFGFSLFSQTIVTTVPQCKNAVLEEYTGIHCGYCPDGHRIAELIRKEYPEQVMLINIHQGGYATPGTGEPDFRTIFGDSLAGQAGITGYPSGTVNRHIFPKLSGSMSLNRGQWYTAITELIKEQSPANVGFTSVFDTNTRELTVNVEVYYTMNSPQSINFLNVAFLENHVIGYQSDYANGTQQNYDHKHIMRHLITGQWGEKIVTTTKGSLVQKTYKYTVPAKYKIENCDVVVYVAESHENIYTGVQSVAVNGSHNGSANTYIGDISINGQAFKKGLSGQASSFAIDVKSAFVSSEDFLIKLNSDAPAGWNSNFKIDGTTYSDSAVINIGGTALKNIQVNCTPDFNPGLATLTLSMKSVANPTATEKFLQVYVISGVTDLIINNDASWGNDGDTNASTYQQVFIDGLKSAGIVTYAATPLSVYEMGYTSLVLDEIKNIYYNVGWSFPSLTDSNVAKFKAFLDKGGNMFISGQDIGWETFNTTTTDYATPNTKSFVSNYLKAGWSDDGSTSQNMLSPITGESVFNISNNSAIVNVYGKNPADNKPFMYPDVVYGVSGGQPIFYYNGNSNQVAGVRNNSGTFKTVYLAVSLEMISVESVRNQIMKLSYDWFKGSIQDIEYDQQMQALMGQSYPNPASGYTIVPLNNISKNMQMVITDISGREIQKLYVDKGSKEVRINLELMDAGIYFCKLMDESRICGVSKLVVSE